MLSSIYDFVKDSPFMAVLLLFTIAIVGILIFNKFKHGTWLPKKKKNKKKNKIKNKIIEDEEEEDEPEVIFKKQKIVKKETPMEISITQQDVSAPPTLEDKKIDTLDTEVLDSIPELSDVNDS